MVRYTTLQGSYNVMRAQDHHCGLRGNESGPDACARIHDCGPGWVLYYEPSVQLVASRYTYLPLARRCRVSLGSW